MRTDHIENRRLFEMASGGVKLEVWELQHLHVCKICQGVLYVFVNQPIPPFSEKPPNPANAA